MELPKAEFSIVTRTSSKAWIPELIAAAGSEVTETYIDFFTATIRNRNTRAAYARACWQFFDWCAAHGLELTSVRPFHVAAWIEDIPGSKPTVKQKLAAVRMLFDFWLFDEWSLPTWHTPFADQKYVVKKGKTPVFSREDAKTLLDSISKDSVSGLPDRRSLKEHEMPVHHLLEQILDEYKMWSSIVASLYVCGELTRTRSAAPSRSFILFAKRAG